MSLALRNEASALKAIERADQFLLKADSLESVIKVIDFAGVAQAAGRALKSEETRKHAKRLEIKAKIKAGKKLQEDIPKIENKRLGNKLLPDIGISKSESSRWQKMAEAPDEKVEEYLSSADDPSDLGVLNIAKEEQPKPMPKPLPDGEFNVVLADPPWEYEYMKRGSPNKHYATMTLEEILKLRIPAAKDSVLFLWSPAPKLREALRVMEAWGFNYRTCAVWVKDRIGTGYIFRAKHELLLYGTKGSPGAPQTRNRPPSVFEAQRSQHSAKPRIAYEMIERMYPGCRYLELFARGKVRSGWTVWGAEADHA